MVRVKAIPFSKIFDAAGCLSPSYIFQERNMSTAITMQIYKSKL